MLSISGTILTSVGLCTHPDEEGKFPLANFDFRTLIAIV